MKTDVVTFWKSTVDISALRFKECCLRRKIHAMPLRGNPGVSAILKRQRAVTHDPR